LLQLQQDFENELLGMTVCVDDMDEMALPILQRLNMTGTNFLSPSHDLPVAKVDESLPCVLIYDVDGKLVKFLESGFTYDEDVSPLVKRLIQKAAEPKPANKTD